MRYNKHSPNATRVAVALVNPVVIKDEDGGTKETYATPAEFPHFCYIKTLDVTTQFIGDTAVFKMPVRISFLERPDCRRGTRIIREEDGRQFMAKGPPESLNGVQHLVYGEATD